MNTKHLLHRELHPILEAVPPFQFRLDNLERFRSARATAAVLGDADAAGVRREEVIIKSESPTGDSYDMSCLLYTPKQPGTTGAYLHIHGGGYIGGRKEYSDPMNTRIAATLGITVLAVGYRLAPEHPVPAPLDDCYSALAWLHTQAAQLGIDPARIAIGGESAGGGLAAALAIRARDEGKYSVCHQHLTYPMLDDRTGTPEHFGDPLVGEFVWNRDNNRFGWSSYLGEHPAQAPYVPARVAQVDGLPPTWLFTVSLDLFRDENIAYAQRLLAAGIDTELVVMPGACHGFQLLPNTSFSKRYVAAHLEALGRALKSD
jgi:acetyl esterase/lipase